MHELIPQPDGHFEERPYSPGSVHEPGDLVALTVYGELFYGVARELLDQLNEIRNLQRPRAIILRIRRAYSIDYSCWNALFDFAEAFAREGGRLYLAGIRPDIRLLIKQARMEKYLPPEQTYPRKGELLQALKEAVNCAMENLGETRHLPGYWLDYLENPVVLTEHQIRDIGKFLTGDAFNFGPVRGSQQGGDDDEQSD
jgi:anti-anti-sigma regulatory factor